MRPWLTYALLLAMALVYLGEALLHADVQGSLFDPSLQTLVAWGGMSRTMVEKGEWFRILTAAFVHGGLAHLAMNSLALYIAGSALEPIIGRWWFAGLYFLSAVGGGVASITINAPNIVGVGASGAIMGLFGFFLTIAFRFPKGPVRQAFIANSLGTLIPSTLPALLPLITGGSGFSIDYAAHGGGAAVGAVVGLLFVFIWRPEQRFPPLAAFAAVVTLAAVCVLGWGAHELRNDFAEQSFAARLMPDDIQPKTSDEARRRADDIIRRFPTDPRGHYYKALSYADKNDNAGTEREARIAVDLAERYPGIFRDSFRARTRMIHALALQQLNRDAEAKTAAGPVCGQSNETEIIDVLKRNGLC